MVVFFNDSFIANFLQSVPVKEFKKSAENWLSYRYELGVLLFFRTRCIHLYSSNDSNHAMRVSKPINRWLRSSLKSRLIRRSRTKHAAAAASQASIVAHWRQSVASVVSTMKRHRHSAGDVCELLRALMKHFSLSTMSRSIRSLLQQQQQSWATDDNRLNTTRRTHRSKSEI